MTVGEHLRELFLRGEEVKGHEVAKQIGTTNSTVSKALKAFGALVEARQELFGYNGRYGRKTWKCVDIPGMCRWRAPNVGGDRTPAKADATSLLDVWGIRVADIPLPSTIHRLMPITEELEAA